jgi:hypothetical protein
MELSYNGLALDHVGELTITGPLETFEPPENPQRKLCSLRVRVDVLPQTHAAGEQLIREVRQALRQQQAVLRWRNPAALGGAGEDYVNWPATVSAMDLPDDPNGWGTWHRQFTLTFTWVETLTDGEAANIGTGNVATFQKTGTATSIPLGHITGWEEGLVNQRPNEMRSQRNRVGGSVSVRGFIGSDHRLSLGARRDAMFATLASLRTVVNGTDGRLRRGTYFDRVVRVERFLASPDEETYRINWSCEVSWNFLPDETNYETCQFTAVERTGRDQGTTLLGFSGTIAADTLVRARSKLDQLRAAVLGQYPGITSHRLSASLTPSWISVSDAPVTDAATLISSKGFTEVRFDEEFLLFNAPLTGARLSLRYGRRIRVNRLSRDVTTSVDGQLFGPEATLIAAQNRATGNFLDAFFTALGLAAPREDDRGLTHEALPPADWVSGTAVTLPTTAANALDFSAVFDGQLAGDDTILECECTEDIQYSGKRWVEQPLPDDDVPSEIQNCGKTPGGRTISGTVKSADVAAAVAWAIRKRKLLECVSVPDTNEVTAFETAPRLTTTYAWVPLVDGVADADREEPDPEAPTNVKVYTVAFQFAEIVPDLPFSG